MTLQEENEKLRGLLREAIHCCPDEQLRNEMKAALSPQAEPTPAERAEWIDANVSGKATLIQAMKNIAGCNEVEPAPAQDERANSVFGTYLLAALPTQEK